MPIIKNIFTNSLHFYTIWINFNYISRPLRCHQWPRRYRIVFLPNMTPISKYSKTIGSIFHQSFSFFFKLYTYSSIIQTNKLCTVAEWKCQQNKDGYSEAFSVNLPYKNRVHYDTLHTGWHHRERKQCDYYMSFWITHGYAW